MPIHDWPRVDAGIFHHFHHSWIFSMSRALNAGVLPPNYYALAEQVGGGLSRITIRHRSGDQVVAVIEIVSPGNKASRFYLGKFVEKALQLLDAGIHLLVIDLFPPGPRDPQGIHGAIWAEIQDDAFRLPDDQPLTLAAYSAGEVKQAFIEPVAVGQDLPDMPLFLEPDHYVPVPLETTYRTAFDAVPRRWQQVLGPSPAP